MKTIEVDEELYQFIAGNTKKIGESASEILRRLLGLDKDIEIEQPEPVAVEVGNNKVEASDVGLFEQLDSCGLENEKGAVGRFLKILSMLHQLHKDKYNQVLQVKGRNRLYFADNKADLLQAGSSTNPKQIDGSDYWVICNSNSARKKATLAEVANVLGYSEADAKRIGDYL